MAHRVTHPYFDVPRPTILGHRGAAGTAPENTLESFAAGLDAGAHIIETDIHVTRDGVPVLIHDPEIDRTTNGRGRIGEIDWDEVQTYDAAAHFSTDAGATQSAQGRGIRVPSLAQAFERFPGVRFNLEIKAPGRELAQRVLDLIAEHDRADLTLLTAGEDEDMADLRSVLKTSAVRPALGASLADILDVIRATLEGRPPETDSLAIQVPDSFGGRPLITPELVAHAHAHGVAIHVWTINDSDQMSALLDLGVDGLVTDHPERMAALLAQRSNG